MARVLFSLLAVLVISQFSTASPLTEVDLKAPLHELASIFRSEFPLPQHIALDRHIRASQRKLLQDEQPAPEPCAQALQQLKDSGCMWKPQDLRRGPDDLAEHLRETCQRCDLNSLESSIANVIDRCSSAQDLAGIDMRFTGMLRDLMEHVCGDIDCFAQLLSSFLSGDGDGGDPSNPEPTKPTETGDDCFDVCYRECANVDDPLCIEQCLPADCKPVDPCKEHKDWCETDCAGKDDVEVCMHDCVPTGCRCADEVKRCHGQCKDEPTQEAIATCADQCLSEEGCTPPTDVCADKLGECGVHCSSHDNLEQCVRDCVPQHCVCSEVHNSCTASCSNGEGFDACYATCMGEGCGPHTDPPYPPTYPPIPGGCDLQLLCDEECGHATGEQKVQCVDGCVQGTLGTCAAQCSPGSGGSNYNPHDCIQSCIANAFNCDTTSNTDPPITHPPIDPPITLPPIRGECEVHTMCGDQCGHLPGTGEGAQCVGDCVQAEIDRCNELCVGEDDPQGCRAFCLGEDCEIYTGPTVTASETIGTSQTEATQTQTEATQTEATQTEATQTEATQTEATQTEGTITEPPISTPPTSGECEAFSQCRDGECGQLAGEAKAQCIQACVQPKVAACATQCPPTLIGPSECIAGCLGDNCDDTGHNIVLPNGPPTNGQTGLLSFSSNNVRARAYYMARAREYIKLQQEQGQDEQRPPRQGQSEGGLENLPDALCLPCARRFIDFASDYLNGDQNRDTATLTSSRCLSRSFDIVCARETGSNERCIDRYGEVFGNFDGSSTDGNLGEFCESSCLWDMSTYYEEILDSGCLGGGRDSFEDFSCQNNFRLSDVCTKNERGQICSEAAGNFDFSGIENNCNVDMSSMNANSTLLECPAACSSGISDAVDELGCCVPFMMNIGCNPNANALELFVETRCGVELPETCVRPTRDLSAASTLSHLSLSAVLLAVSALALSN